MYRAFSKRSISLEWLTSDVNTDEHVRIDDDEKQRSDRSARIAASLLRVGPADVRSATSSFIKVAQAIVDEIDAFGNRTK